MQALLQRALVVLIVVVGAAGCASTSIRSAWFDPTFKGGPFKRIVVVGVHGNVADRRVFEDIFAQRLKAVGVDAIPGWTVFPGDVPPSEQVGTAAVEAARADGLLAVRLLRVDTQTQVNTAIVPGPMMWGPYGGWWGGGMVAVPQVTQYSVASVETNLWDVRTRRIVWAATTDTFDPQSVPRETPAFADVIIGQLVARGLVPGK